MKCNSKKNNWQQALMNAVCDPKELLTLLNLDNAFLNGAEKAANLFPLKVPRNFIARMEKRNPNDPLLLQVLPLHLELDNVVGYLEDPLQEAQANLLPGLLHKYHGRVLLMITGNC